MFFPLCFSSVSSLNVPCPRRGLGIVCRGPRRAQILARQKTPSVGRALNEKSKGGVADTGAESSVFILEMHACRLAKAEKGAGGGDNLTWPNLAAVTRRTPPAPQARQAHTGDSFFPNTGRVVQVTQPRGQRNGRLKEETGRPGGD